MSDVNPFLKPEFTPHEQKSEDKTPSPENLSDSLLVRRSPRFRDFYESKLADRAVRKAERQHQRKMSTLADWTDPEDRALRYKELRAERRIALITRVCTDLHCPTFTCPLCKMHKPDPLSWVILRRGVAGCCKSCFQRETRNRSLKVKEIIALIRRVAMNGPAFVGVPKVVVESSKIVSIEPQPPRFKINHLLFSGLREQSGLSSKEFAVKMGWSSAYQSKLESGHTTSLSQEVWEKMVVVLRDAGIQIK